MIGFMGGSFDPVHFGHLYQARAIKQELALSQLFLMPCNMPVHKADLYFSNQQRLAMLNLALEAFDDLSISFEEINNPTQSYTIDTLKRLKIKHPHQSLCLIIGADSFATLDTWKDYQQLQDYAQLVVLPRNDSSNTANIPNKNKGVYFAKTPQVNISSTQVRSILFNPALKGKIREQDLSGLLPEVIIEYIQRDFCNNQND